MKPTPEQDAVIKTENQTLIVEAGAGTGKTWALVGRFIYMLDQHEDWPLESLIAITFTIKAAREMRSRVRDAIEQRARQNPHNPTWQARRRNLDRLQISTIHSLCARILRENAIAAQIDPKFEVLDEQQADRLREAAVRDTVHQMVAQQHASLALLETLNVRDLKEEMLNLLAERGIMRLLFDALPDQDGLLEHWQTGLEAMRSAQWEQALAENEDLAEALQAIPEVEIVDNTDLLADSVAHAIQGCAAMNRGRLVEALQHWLGLSFSGGKQANWGGKDAFIQMKNWMKALRVVARAMEKSGSLQAIGDLDRLSAWHLQLWRQVWDLLNQVYDALKDEQQALDFDDLETLTVTLTQQRPVPQRLQLFLESINHLMVDELQDVNPVQKEIITSLAPISDPGKLFTVGDAKQSIYRFRQAQVSIFNQTAREIRAATGQKPLPLSTSFRTHHRLVIALNHLFERCFQPLVGRDYQDFEARPGPLTANRQGRDAPQPCVEMLLLPDKDLNDENIHAEDARIGEARWIASRILQLSGEKVPVWDKAAGTTRNFQFQDAAVLFRATTHLPLYEAEFKAAGVPYLTVSGRGYYDRPEVQDLVALLSALLNSQDDLNLAAALRSPLFSLSDETLYRLRRINPNGEYQKEPLPYRWALNHPPECDQPEWVERAVVILEELWQICGHCDTWQLLRLALDKTGFETVLAINDGQSGRQLANVHKFLAQARDQGDLSLGDFLAHLAELQSREAREGEGLGREPESGAVQLMSIHAAKGLEFPVVFLADLGRQKSGRSDSPYLLHDPEFGMVCKVRDPMGDWLKPVPAGYGWAKWINDIMETAENKRLLYVACTRAADLLILTGRLGSRQTWLSELIDAWGIDPDGEPLETSDQGEYQIRVYRPRALAEPYPVLRQHTKQTIKLDTVPALARPLDFLQRVVSLNVTDFVEMLAQKEQDTLPIRPAVWEENRQLPSPHIPGHLLGNLVHDLLAKGFFEPQKQKDYTRQLSALADQRGLKGAQKAAAIRLVSQMLRQLEVDSLFEEITSAQQRHHELPFSWDSPVGSLNGMIDLLYQAPSGEWHLVDWKTEHVIGQNLESFIEQHTLQMAIYYQAVSEILKIDPITKLVCLYPALRTIHLTPDVLANQLSDLRLS